MKVSPFVFVAFLAAVIIHSTVAFKAHKNYEKEISAPWQLALRSATLIEKSRLIDQYITNIESNRANFASHDAVWYKTDANSFDHNLRALKSLQTRLKEVQEMDQNELAYSKAIEQITDQEQSDSKACFMNGSIKGSYFLKTHICSWDWIGLILIFGEIFLFFGWLILLLMENP